MKVDDKQRFERTEKMMMRWMFGVILKERKGSEELRRRLGIRSLSDTVREGRRKRFGHVERKDEVDWVSACIEM